MAKRKKQLRRKNELKRKTKTNRKRKIKLPKRKQKRINVHCRTSKKTKRVSVEKRYWGNRKSAKPKSVSRYSRKTLLSRENKTKFKIKKKMKQLRPMEANKNTLDALTNQTKRYLSLKRSPKSVYLKAMIIDSKGNRRWISVARQDMADAEDIRGAWDVVLSNLRGGNYGGHAKIIGYEVEQVL